MYQYIRPHLLRLSAILMVSLTAHFSVMASAVAETKSAHSDEIVLSNGHTSLTFSGNNDLQFKSFKSNGHELLPPGGQTTHLWQMTFLGPNGENPAIQPRWSYFKGVRNTVHNGQPAVTATWHVALDGNPSWPVNVTIALPDSAEMPSFHIDAGLPDGWTVTDIEFPRITVARQPSAKAILPIGYGSQYELDDEALLQTRYPSVTGSMQLMMITDKADSSTIFFAPRDYAGGNKRMTIQSYGQTSTMAQQVTANYDWSRDGHFVLPYSVEIGYNPQGWIPTALKWYRPWALKAQWADTPVDKRDIAPWIRDADLWLRPADVSDETFAAVIKALDYFSPGVGLHWYYWHQHPFDTKYPEYFPAKEGFTEMIKEVHRKHAHVTPYINGRLWDPSTESYRNCNGAAASCRTASGALYTEIYGSKVPNTVTCPSSPIWREKLYETNRMILDSLGVDGVYMDQIGCAPAEPCYADNHPHGKGGGSWWPEAYRSLLTGMREAFYTPSQAMTTEENAEPYLDLFDMMLVVNSPHSPAVRMVPLFPLIYSDRCVYSGFTYIPWRITDGSMRYITMRSLLWGSQLGWINPVLLMADNAKAEALFLKNLADFRRQHHDIFFGGRFLEEFVPTGDNPVIDIPGYQPISVVLGAKWLDINSKPHFVVVNMSEQEHRVSLPDGRNIKIPALSAKSFKVKN